MEEKKEIIQIEKKDPNSTLRFWTTILGIIAVIVLIGLKLADMISLKYLIIIGVSLGIVWLFAMFGKTLTDKFTEKPEVTGREVLTKEKIEELMHETVGERLWDHIKKPNGIKHFVTRTEGNDTICYALVELLNQSALGKENEYIVIINASNQDIIPTLMPKSECPEEVLERLINKKSQKPKDEPYMEYSKEGVDSFGKPTRETKRIIPKEKEEKKEEGGVA